jgi:hypothetical protein
MGEGGWAQPIGARLCDRGVSIAGYYRSIPDREGDASTPKYTSKKLELDKAAWTVS